MGRLRPPVRVVACITILAVAFSAGASTATAGTLKKPIDRRQQTSLAFGDRSHWLQPWRAYLETPPALNLRRAMGIHFNVEAQEAPATARLLAQSGFSRARVEFGWNSMSYEDPSRLEDPGKLRDYLRPLRANGLRPLILLNANHGIPGPTRFFDAVLTQPARAGDRHVQLDAATARAVVPHKTGLSSRTQRRAADVIFTSLDPTGRATLSRPLPHDLSPGPHAAATLRYGPFGPPRLRNGRPNPRFEETLGGWLAYVGAVTREARAVLGSQNFDVEVWNELSFDADFLYQERYYDPPREEGRGETDTEILNRTVAYLRDPRNGVPQVGIGNGFANQRPWDSGANSPRGLTAIDKHPYRDFKRFPEDSIFDGVAPLDAKGRMNLTESHAPDGGLIRRDGFVPRYDAFFPEYFLSAIQTEHLVRDISPITTDVYKTTLHGRRTRPRGGKAPGVWITETNMDPKGTGLEGAEVQQMQAKAALRYFTSFVNKGVSAVHLFAVKDPNLALVDPSQPDGGPTLRAIRRLNESIAGATTIRRPRPLSLLKISDRHDHRQFNGNGSAAHPPLYNRDVLGFFPFQVRNGEYAAAVYVMTRNIAKALPPERYSLTIGGLRSSRVRATASDPLTGEQVRVKVRRAGRTRIRVSIPVTDSPRMLRLSQRPATAVSLRAKRRRVSRHSARQTFTGRVRSRAPGCAGRVVVILRRRSGPRWRRARVVSGSSARAGRFSVSVRRLKAGSYRARAIASRRVCGGTRSRSVRFRVR